MERRRLSASWVFKDTEYLLSCCVTDDMLEVTVEETLSTNTWKGIFEAKHIEEITRKTGNFKQFLVFATMLESAINKSSECVTLDLLTYADLETLRERRNAASTGKKHPSKPAPSSAHQQQQQQQQSPHSKRYLILTYSVEFDRIHYPLALAFTGQADSAQLRDTIQRLATELDKCKKQGKRNAALTKLQKEYDVLLQEKEALEEVVESLQTQLLAVDGGEGKAKKQLKMLQKVIRNLEEEMMQERSKHQRYVNKKTEEMRALTQELAELRSSERTLRSRVKNLTNELSLLKKGLRSSPSGTYLRTRQSPSSFKRTPSSGRGSGGVRRRTQSGGSLERTLSSGSRERRLGLGLSGGGRTPSPRAYIENKKREQKENKQRFQRLSSPSYRGRGTRSRSSSVEKAHYCPGSGGVSRSLVQLRSGSRRLWGPHSDSYKGTRTRSSSLGSLSGRSSAGSSAASSRASSRRPSLSRLSDIEPSPPTTGRGNRSTNKNKRLTHSSQKLNSSTPATKPKNKNSGSLLDHSAEMSEIDARLNALQQFMKQSLETTSKTHSKR